MSSGENMFEGIMESDLIPAVIYMPITTVQQLYPNSERLSSIDVSLVEKDKLREVGRRIVQYLEMKHGSEDVYMAQNSADIQKAFSDVLGVVSSILLVIAVITLIVRYRHSEYPAGISDGEDKRDRHQEGPGSPEEGYSTAVSDRIHADDRDRRPRGYIAGSSCGGIISALIKIPRWWI